MQPPVIIVLYTFAMFLHNSTPVIIALYTFAMFLHNSTPVIIVLYTFAMFLYNATPCYLKLMISVFYIRANFEISMFEISRADLYPLA